MHHTTITHMSETTATETQVPCADAQARFAAWSRVLRRERDASCLPSEAALVRAEDGTTLLHVAAAIGLDAAATALIHAGADVSARDSEG